MQGVAKQTEFSVVSLPLAGWLPYLTKDNLGTCDVTGGCHNSDNLLVNVETAQARRVAQRHLSTQSKEGSARLCHLNGKSLHFVEESG